MDVYRAYFRDHPEFDTTNLRQAAPNLPCPRVDRAFLALTGQYALDHNFGWPRKQPPAAPIDLESGAGFQPARAGWKPASLGTLEITGVGGGDWTFKIASGRLVDRGRCDSPMVTIRLRSDTLSALVTGRLGIEEALQAGRILLAAPSELAESGVELLNTIVAQLRSPPKVNGTHRADHAAGLLTQGEKSS